MCVTLSVCGTVAAVCRAVAVRRLRSNGGTAISTASQWDLLEMSAERIANSVLAFCRPHRCNWPIDDSARLVSNAPRKLSRTSSEQRRLFESDFAACSVSMGKFKISSHAAVCSTDLIFSPYVDVARQQVFKLSCLNNRFLLLSCIYYSKKWF